MVSRGSRFESVRREFRASCSLRGPRFESVLLEPFGEDLSEFGGDLSDVCVPRK